MSANEVKKEKRQFIRYAIEGHVDGDWFNNDHPLDVMVVDVSSNGIGILAHPSPSAGDKVTLNFHKNTVKSVAFTVRWCRHDISPDDVPGLEDMKRCGLEIESQDLDLVELLKNHEEIHIED